MGVTWSYAENKLDDTPGIINNNDDDPQFSITLKYDSDFILVNPTTNSNNNTKKKCPKVRSFEYTTQSNGTSPLSSSNCSASLLKPNKLFQSPTKNPIINSILRYNYINLCLFSWRYFYAMSTFEHQFKCKSFKHKKGSTKTTILASKQSNDVTDTECPKWPNEKWSLVNPPPACLTLEPQYRVHPTIADLRSGRIVMSFGIDGALASSPVYSHNGVIYPNPGVPVTCGKTESGGSSAQYAGQLDNAFIIFNVMETKNLLQQDNIIYRVKIFGLYAVKDECRNAFMFKDKTGLGHRYEWEHSLIWEEEQSNGEITIVEISRTQHKDIRRRKPKDVAVIGCVTHDTEQSSSSTTTPTSLFELRNTSFCLKYIWPVLPFSTHYLDWAGAIPPTPPAPHLSTQHCGGNDDDINTKQKQIDIENNNNNNNNNKTLNTNTNIINTSNGYNKYGSPQVNNKYPTPLTVRAIVVDDINNNNNNDNNNDNNNTINNNNNNNDINLSNMHSKYRWFGERLEDYLDYRSCDPRIRDLISTSLCWGDTRSRINDVEAINSWMPIEWLKKGVAPFVFNDNNNNSSNDDTHGDIKK